MNNNLNRLLGVSVINEGVSEQPHRNEFYTNYPSYKYWGKNDNSKLFSSPGINIYIHIPFCIQICDYCFYMKELVKSKDQINTYVDFLCKEIELVSKRFNLKDKKVNSIYIGGGTPSVLTETQFKRLTETLHQWHNIQELEFTIEAEPGTFSKNKLQCYKEIGVNRLSMGIQSFDDEVIKLSSRKHSSMQALNSISLAKENGAFQVNIDLLSGLAGETMSSWIKTLEIAFEQRVDMLTIYKMKAYSNTVFFQKGVYDNKIELPSSEQEIEFMKKALETAGEKKYGMWSTFAFNLNGSQSKYIEHTWRGEDLIAYGASSFGRIREINYQNLNNINAYYEKISQEELPLYRSFALSVKDQIVREILLCSARLFSYRKSEFVSKFGFDYFDLIPEMIEQLVELGYIEQSKEELILTSQGILFGDFVSKLLAESVKNILGRDKIDFKY